MKGKFLGDSYDIVKRLWADLLLETAPLYAAPVFYKDRVLRQAFTQLTRIRMMDEGPSGTFSVLLDPDTGVSLTNKHPPGHVTPAYIADQFTNPGVKFVVTYDQSYRREKPKPKRQQMQEKMTEMIKRHGCPSFYYVSHASFLFAAKSQQDLRELRTIIEKAGVPACKLEKLRTARDASRTS